MNEKYVNASTIDSFSFELLNQVCHVKLFNIQSSTLMFFSLPKIAPFSTLIAQSHCNRSTANSKYYQLVPVP